MANKIKGEVGFKAAGQDYVLLLDFNALCELEDVVPGLMDGTANLASQKAVRAVFHAGLAEHHPELTDKDAGRLIHEIGLERAAELIGESCTASFGTPGVRRARTLRTGRSLVLGAQPRPLDRSRVRP